MLAALSAALALMALPLSAAAASGQDYTFAFQDADIAMAAQEVLGAAGVSYSIDPSVTGRLTFRIERRLTRDQLLAAFEAVLEQNGVALVRNGDQVLLTSAAKAKASATVRPRGEAAFGAGYEVVAVPVSFGQPSEIQKALEAVSPPNTVLYANDKLGMLVLGGNGPQLKAALEALRLFDQSTLQDARIRWFELSHAESAIVAGELERLVQGSGIAGVSIVPLRRLNGVFVFSRSAETLNRVSEWVARLDTPGKEAASTLWTYHARASSAEQLAQTLNRVFGLQNSVEVNSISAQAPTIQSTAATNAPATATATAINSSSLSPDDAVRISADRDTNTLIVFAAPTRWLQIQRILAEIDHTPRQVLIEASILEVTLGKEFELGVDWSVLSGDLAISSIGNSSGAIGAAFPGFSVTYLENDVRAAVNALGSRTNVEVVSTPKILALDNRTARLQIGDQVPIVTQTSQTRNDANAALINTIEYRSTGVILNVTPRVTGDDQLVLDVAQEVSAVARTVTSGIDSPTIQQRRFESSLVLHDGAVVALGGLISSNRTISDAGVPWLKDIPAVGSLFKSQDRRRDRSELIVLLTAKIVKDRAGAEGVTNDLLDDMREIRARGLAPPRP
jgi:general secretion pathway protein D